MIKKIILLLIVCLNLKCACPLITEYKQNNIQMEKINIQKLHKYEDGKAGPNEEVIFYANKKENQKNNFMIKQTDGEKVSLISIDGQKDNHLILTKQVITPKWEERYSYYEDGNLKSREKKLNEQTIKDPLLNTIHIQQLPVGKFEYFDENGNPTKSIDYDSVSIVTLEEVINYARENRIKEPSIGMLYLNADIKIDKSIHDDLINKNVPVEYFHPYWVISTGSTNDIGQLLLQRIYMDGNDKKNTWIINETPVTRR